ncbi:hypothetical protein PI125_g3026 [Phytophthora idaei]|nr:hypothetical protein PI125_g3026 [Phytophthora idaei]KAG3165338.1 hypothetical protein PI126_g4692 [Phytophthora idaei]
MIPMKLFTSRGLTLASTTTPQLRRTAPCTNFLSPAHLTGVQKHSRTARQEGQARAPPWSRVAGRPSGRKQPGTGPSLADLAQDVLTS